MLEDKYIWDEFKSGEDYALSHIYHQNIDFLFYYGKKFTDDEELILDTIQDLFYDLIRNRKSLGKTDNIRFYLATAVKRRLFHEIKNKKKQILSNDDILLEAKIIFSVEEELIKSEELSNQLRLIRLGMNELNTKQREVLYYKFTCDFSYEQICEIMSISYDSARQLVSRAISSMKKYLSENDLILMLITKKLAFAVK